jgi:hypothetical protein
MKKGIFFIMWLKNGSSFNVNNGSLSSSSIFLIKEKRMLIKDILYGYYNTQCLYTVSKLRIAEHLKTGSKSITELASLEHCDENQLYRIMRFLSAKGLFDELNDQIFSLNEESNYLLSSTSGNLKNFIDLHALYFYQAATKIFESMSAKSTPFEIKFGKPAWKLFEERPDVGQIYNVAMQEVSEYYGKLAIKKYDFSLYKTIVDVGGGLGSFLVNILRSNASANGINFDLPSLQDDAERYFIQEGMSLRCQYIAGNFFETIPATGDLYIFKAIFHGKTDEQALRILHNTKRVLPTHAKLLLIERMITHDDNFIDGCLNDINMLNITNGCVRTLEEYKELFKVSGFSISQIEPLEDALQMIELQNIPS